MGGHGSASGRPVRACFAAGARARADRRGRGARRLLQAGGRSPVRRAREVARRRADRPGRPGLRQRDAPAESWERCPAPTCPSERTASPAPGEILDMRIGSGSRGPRHARTAQASTRALRAARQGDRDAQPPRVVAAPVRAGPCGAHGNAPNATSRWSAQAPRAGFAATTAATRSAPAIAAGLRLGDARPPWDRHPSGGRLWRSSAARCRSSASTPTARRRAGAHCDILRRFDGADRGDPGGHADGRQGPRLPGRRLSVVLDADATCGFPTSDPRSGRSRSSRSSPGAAAAARAEGPGTGPDPGSEARGDPPAAATTRGFPAAELERRRRWLSAVLTPRAARS
jgi:hypothetical protein